MSQIIEKFDKFNKFDKPHLPLPSYDLSRKPDMFSAVLSLDTHEILQCNLMYKIPFTITDENKNSLIHILLNNPSKSSELAKLSVIKFLINNGVDPDKPNKYNQTALHLACNQQSEKIVEYLLSIRVDPNYKDNAGFTPFHHLLSGSINPIPSTEIIDFIPATNNINLAKIELIKDMKQKAYSLITPLTNLPIFETIQNTIIAFINDDVEIKKIIQDFTDAQLFDLQMANNIYTAEDNLESVKLFETKITQRIKNKLVVKPLEELTIHPKLLNSWTYPDDTGEFALIKDGNIKNSIRTTIKNQYTSLVKLTSDFIPYKYLFDLSIYKIIYDILYITNTLQIMDYMYLDLRGIWNTDDRFSQYRTNDAADDSKIKVEYQTSLKKTFIEKDNKLRYINAFDNASSIINFYTLKYTGGPRNIILGYNNHNYTKENLTAEILNILDKLIATPDDELIVYMLNSNPSFESLLSRLPPLSPFTNIDDSSNLTAQHSEIINNNISKYIHLSFEAIQHKLKKRITINTEITKFSDKWFNMWKPDKDFDLGAWIYNMWTDCSCRISRSNLVGHVSFKLLILINNLNDITNIKLNIFNSLKPHLISIYIDSISKTSKIDNSIVLINIIIILLYDSDNFNDIDLIIKNPYKLHTDYLSKMPNINYMYLLIQKYFPLLGDKETQIKEFINLDPELKNYCNTYKYDKFIDILCNMILDEYKNMTNKPLKQTILDFLYLLNKYNNTGDITEFKFISIISILTYKTKILDETTLNVDLNNGELYDLMPSNYGYFNVINSTSAPTTLNTQYNEILKRHFIIAHILGLYYEGTLNMIDTDAFVNLNNLINAPNNSNQYFIPGIIPIIDTSRNWIHTLNSNNELNIFQVPLPLQFTYINTHVFQLEHDDINNRRAAYIYIVQVVAELNTELDRLINLFNQSNVNYTENNLRNIINLITNIRDTFATLLAEINYINGQINLPPNYLDINKQHIINKHQNFINKRIPDTINIVPGLQTSFQNLGIVINHANGILAYINYLISNEIQVGVNQGQDDITVRRRFVYMFLVDIRPVVVYMENTFKSLIKEFSYNYDDYADFYNIWDRPMILPTTIDYFIFLYNKIKYYQEIIKKEYTKIEKDIKQFITGKPNDSKDTYSKNYFNIIILSKIINNYYKSYKEVETVLLKFSNDFLNIREWLEKIPEIKVNNGKLELDEIPIYYDQIAEKLNKINSSYYLYHYIFQNGDNIKLEKFNYFQLPIENEANKYLYFSAPGSGSVVLDVYGTSSDIPSIGTITSSKLNNIGLFNIYDITNYTTSYDKYLSNPYINNKTSDTSGTSGEKNESFMREKKESLPPSVYLNFEDFYKYTTIYLITKIISDKININIKNLFEICEKYITKYIQLPESMIEIYTYFLISKIIEQLIINHYTANITDQMIQNKLTIMQIGGASVSSPGELINFDFLIANLEKYFISIKLNNSKLKITEDTDLSNLYNLVIPPTTSSDDKVIFILYPNDLTNINKFKIKNGITIKPSIIKLLIDSGGIPYHLNMENSTPIDYLLKNYQIETIKKLYDTLNNSHIQFYNSKNSIKYIMGELTNMLSKIIPNTTIPNIINQYKLNSVLLNFHEYLYQDIHQLILANNRYGNNEFICIPISFNISTYLILHYLKTTIDIDETNKPIYLYTQIDKLEIYKDINSLIAEDVLSTKTTLLKTYNDCLEKLNIIGNLNKLEKTYKTELEKQIADILTQIDFIKGKIIDKKFFDKTDININTTLITAYKQYEYNKVKSLKALKVWEKFFDTDFNITENYDMELINIIIEQINILKEYNKEEDVKKKEENLQKLKKISDKLKKISTIGEDYFTKPKFTDDNESASFIKEMLIYIAKITFETSIFLLVKRILFNYFTEMFNESNPTKINKIIRFILKDYTNASNKTFMKTLVEQTIPDLVTLASNIYENKKDEMNYETNTSRQILLNLFEHLKGSKITLSEEILNIFDKQVVEYLDTFIVKTIEMWHVNAENIFKYFINNYRCLATLICLIDHNNKNPIKL